MSEKIAFDVRVFALKTNNFKWLNFAKRFAWLLIYVDWKFSVKRKILYDDLKENHLWFSGLNLILRWVYHHLHPQRRIYEIFDRHWKKCKMISNFGPVNDNKFRWEEKIHSWLILCGLGSRELFLAKFSATLLVGDRPEALKTVSISLVKKSQVRRGNLLKSISLPSPADFNWTRNFVLCPNLNLSSSMILIRECLLLNLKMCQ